MGKAAPRMNRNHRNRNRIGTTDGHSRPTDEPQPPQPQPQPPQPQPHLGPRMGKATPRIRDPRGGRLSTNRNSPPTAQQQVVHPWCGCAHPWYQCGCGCGCGSGGSSVGRLCPSVVPMRLRLRLFIRGSRFAPPPRSLRPSAHHRARSCLQCGGWGLGYLGELRFRTRGRGPGRGRQPLPAPRPSRHGQRKAGHS